MLSTCTQRRNISGVCPYCRFISFKCSHKLIFLQMLPQIDIPSRINCDVDNVHTEAKYKRSLPILSVYFLQMFPQIDIHDMTILRPTCTTRSVRHLVYVHCFDVRDKQCHRFLNCNWNETREAMWDKHLSFSRIRQPCRLSIVDCRLSIVDWYDIHRLSIDTGAQEPEHSYMIILGQHSPPCVQWYCQSLELVPAACWSYLLEQKCDGCLAWRDSTTNKCAQA